MASSITQELAAIREELTAVHQLLQSVVDHYELPLAVEADAEQAEDPAADPEGAQLVQAILDRKEETTKGKGK